MPLRSITPVDPDPTTSHAAATAEVRPPTPLRPLGRGLREGVDIALVGLGPRGLSVLERMLVRLGEHPPTAAVRIWVFDPGEPGAGRIWRPDQPDWLMMNTVTGEVTMYSGCPDGGPARAGAGPSLHQWLADHPDRRWSALGEGDYAPRAAYGQYLRDVFTSLVAHRPANVTVHTVRGAVERVEPAAGGGLRVAAFGGRLVLDVDKVVLATGHPHLEPTPRERELLDHAAGRPGVRYLVGDSAADLDLSGVEPGERVGILGLGLAFFDVTRTLTLGRGGHFQENADGVLEYRASGREPLIFAGSRSGVPILARGVNQKGPTYRYRPRLLTLDALARAREQAARRDGTTALDFRRDVLPLILAEAQHTYYTAQVRLRDGAAAAEAFAERHLAAVTGGRPGAVEQVLAGAGLAPVDLDLERMARPFAGRTFASPQEYRDAVLTLMDADLAEALLGNADGPLKAATDTLRDLRGVLRTAVEFGALQPRSHQHDFLDGYNPVSMLVSTGPGMARVAELQALVRAGLVTLIGPDLRVRPVPEGFALHSPQVAGSRQVVTTFVDGRIPQPSIHHDTSPLTRGLLADGLISEYVNEDPRTGARFATGAVRVTPGSQHVVDAAGRPHPDLHLIGIPTERLRWFTQIGNGRPGPLGGFHGDADAIAVDVLTVLARPQSHRPALLQQAG